MIYVGVVLLPVVLLMLGIPVAFALGLAGLVSGYLYLGPAALIMAPQTMFSSVNSFLLLAIPLFILMSEVLARGGVGEKLFDMANAWLRHLPGGLAISAVVTAAILSSVTGSSIAAAATAAIVALPAMLSRGYEPKFVLGLVAASGTLGILIPPSIPMILYGSITSESVGKLFMAGLIPGVILASILIVYVLFACSDSRTYKRLPAASWTECWKETRKASWGLVLPLAVVGGMYAGLFTPTEAAGVGAAYAAFLSFVVYRSVGFREFGVILLETMQTTSMIILLTAGALVFGSVITLLQVPQQLIQFIIDSNLSAWTFLIIINVVLIILGCFLEAISIIFITIPIVYPALLHLGIDPIWFAVIFVVNLQIGQITPPVGMVLYVIASISGRPLSEVIRGVTPFIFLFIGYLAVLMLVPGLSLWLPQFVK